MEGDCSTIKGTGCITKLLGSKDGGEPITSFIHSIAATSKTSSGGGSSDHPRAEIKTYPPLKNRAACEYHSYKALGVSLCFENSLLQAIHVYNGTHGFSVYKGHLPYGLELNMRGEDVVRLLEEPDCKMGGGRGGPISIAYKDKGLQINFVGSDWEDRHNKIDSITIHEPLET